MQTIGNLFRSRKFVLALVYLVVQGVVSAIPTIAPQAENLMGISAVIVGVALFSITVEDSVRSWAENRPTTPEAAVRTIVEDILKAIFGGNTTQVTTVATALPVPTPVPTVAQTTTVASTASEGAGVG